MKVDNLGTLLHVYYGERTDDSDKSYAIRFSDRGFSGNPYEVGKQDKTYSLDVLLRNTAASVQGITVSRH